MSFIDRNDELVLTVSADAQAVLATTAATIDNVELCWGDLEEEYLADGEELLNEADDTATGVWVDAGEGDNFGGIAFEGPMLAHTIMLPNGDTEVKRVWGYDNPGRSFIEDLIEHGRATFILVQAEG